MEGIKPGMTTMTKIPGHTVDLQMVSRTIIATTKIEKVAVSRF